MCQIPSGRVLVLATLGHYTYSQCAVRIGSVCIYLINSYIELSSILHHIVQNWPRPNLDGLLRFWPNVSALEASWWAGITGPRFLAGYNRSTVSCPLAHSVAFFHRCPVSCRAEPARIQFGSGWLSGFGQTDPVQKQAGVLESSSLLLASASEPIQIRCESNLACLLGQQRQVVQ